jgi:hypothetical protein
MTLQLRCREPESSRAPADIAAFLHGARTLDREASDPILWLLSAEPSGKGVGGMKACARCGTIPTPEDYLARIILEDPDTSSWNFTLRGRAARALAALVLAGGLAFVPASARAGDEEEPTDEAGDADEGDAEETDEGTDEETDEGTDETAMPAPEVTPEPEVEPLSYEGEALWAAVRGARVEITLRGGTRVTGVVLTQAGDELAIARDPDGTVARVPKHMVSRLRVLNMAGGTGYGSIEGGGESAAEKANLPPPDGKAATIVGSILTISGGTMMLAFGLAHLGSSSFYYYGAPLMIIGANLLGPGIPILATGVAQREKRRDWDLKHDVQIGLAPTPGGFAGSLRFTF